MFESEIEFNTMDIAYFYRQIYPDISQTTVNWKISELVKTCAICRIGKGRFIISNMKRYVPEISKAIKTISAKIKKEFPFIQICIWETSILNEFMIHQPGKFYMLVEVDKDTTESVFYFLKELKYSVFLSPKKEMLDRYLPDKSGSVIIIKPLVSESPTQLTENVDTASLEKILVDLFSDEIIFSAFQGAERRTIFEEAFRKYEINLGRMLRYAARRNKKKSFEVYLDTIDSKQK